MIKNLTPHVVNLLDAAGRPWREFPPEQTPARVEEVPAPMDRAAGDEFPCREAPTYGAIVGLPEYGSEETSAGERVYYIVSQVVLDVLRRQGSDRRDVIGVSFHDTERVKEGPDKGKVLGTKAFVRL